jgi:glycosyl hydrolase family 2
MTIPSGYRLPLLFVLSLLLFVSFAARAQAPEPYAWIEGEEPTACSVKPNIAGWGHPEFLSREKWLHISIEAEKVDQEVTGDGILIEYPFSLQKAGPHEVWNRIGFEFVRSPFQWRIDGGEWAQVTPDQLTADLMELADWTEVAWLNLGEKQLQAGAHKLDIRLPKTKDDKGKTARILYASDAICIHSGPFFPNGRHKPDADWRMPQDQEAAKKVFELPAAPPGPPNVGGGGGAKRITLPLAGLWEVCRHDEQLPGETAEPIKDFPARPYWTAIQVPGDKNELRPDLLMAHRLWYRTRVNVPEAYTGRSFHITFPLNNLNTTVYVNGTYCGFNKNPYARFDIDVTKAIKPGVNEVRVGIKDAWYGYSTNPKDPMKLRRKFNIPLSFSHQGFQDLAYPIWNAFRSGILYTPEFVVAGPVKTTDVFCKPSVARKEMAAEVTVANRSGKPASGQVLCQALNMKTGRVEQALQPQPFSLAPDAEQTVQVTGRWENPKLWWPDEPTMYILRTTIVLDDRAVDISDTSFGFREWTAEGKDFKLNGIVWHGWAELTGGKNKEEWLTNYRRTNQRFMRLMGAAQGGISWQGLTTDEALDFFDRNGVVVRRSGPLDGEAIGYMAVENDPDLKKKYGSEIKMDLMENWRDQMVQQVRGERNHPSIHLWSIENEWLYINCINLYGGLMDKFEAEVKRCSDAVRAVDPTRLTMVDGGGAGKDQLLPVHGDHYVFNPSDTRYPDLAYEANPTGGGRGRWVWDQKRPRYLGEDFFATGINPADYAMFGGEPAFQGKAQARPAAGVVYRMLTEGYRWAEYGAWHFWLGEDTATDQYGANAPLAVFSRQWDWTFNSGQNVKRTFGIFNDTRFSDPVSFTWTLLVGGKKTGAKTTVYRVAAGTNQKLDAAIPMPKVVSRQEGQLILTLAVKGKEVFRDVKKISVLPAAAVAAAKPASRPVNAKTVAALKTGTSLDAKSLLAYDPHGRVVSFLKSQGMPFTSLPDLKNLPAAGRVLIVGRDALDVPESTSSRLAAYASSGRTVIVLEQKNPLKYQALPADMEPAAQGANRADGRIAFAEDLNHPAVRGLKQKDFFTWGADHVVYRNAYVKPARGGKSLIQCGVRLRETALAEIPAGKGLVLVSQLVIGEKLGTSPVAGQLLVNLIEYGAGYRLEYRQVAVATKDNPHIPKVLDQIGLQYSKVEDPLQAISSAGARLAIVQASPANLKTLAANKAAVDQFTRGGGYLVFHGLTPDGLEDYNRIVGFEHMIRPFRRERVTFPAVKHPLTSGLTLGDIVMLSGERIFNYTSDEYVANDIFSYVVDYDDVAPFAQFPSDYFHNMVNGMVSADAWKYIFSFELARGQQPEWRMSWPKEQELVQFDWIGNAFYHLVTKVEMVPDGDKGRVATFNTQPNNEPQTFDVKPPLKARELTVRLAEWQKVPGKADVVGVDNLWLKAKRSPEFYKNVRPMLNVGGLMEYPRGAGGIVLCNLLLKDAETVPVNAAKKRAILAALLRNLKAPFSGGSTVIAGSNLQYAPIDISKQATQYRDEKGWFGDKAFTFAGLPTGKQVLAGVPFQVYDFPTSPVPTVLMLGGPGVPNNLPTEIRGIPVNRKADALFFLQAARIDRRRSPQEVRDRKQFELVKYVVTYADGQQVEIPVYSETDVEDYRQKGPAAIPGAQIAWTRPYDGTEWTAVAYTKQWDNPRPDVEIKSIDMVSGKDRRGVPALIALTAATAGK